MHWLSDPGLGLSFALTLATIFVWTGVSKLSAIDEFVGVVANYRLMPRALIRPFGLSMPWVEISAGIGVLLPWTRSVSAMILAILLLVFSFAIAVNLRRGRTYIDCGCFRMKARRPLSYALVVRNLVLLAMAGVVIVWQGGRPLAWLDFVTACCAAMALSLIYVATPMLSSPTTNADLEDAAILDSGETSHA